MEEEREHDHEVYGGDIPFEGDMDDHNDQDVEMDRADAAALKLQELEQMKMRLKEMEEEAASLKEMQAKIEKEIGTAQDPAIAATTESIKNEVDSRSVYVGNVHYACTPEEVQQHFQSCGTVNRVTILTNEVGQPMGYAFVEFLEFEAVQVALQLDESELHGRQLKISPKRTNIPGMKQNHPHRLNLYRGYPFKTAVPPYFYSPYGYGRGSKLRGRGRGRNRYCPYY